MNQQIETASCATLDCDDPIAAYLRKNAKIVGLNSSFVLYKGNMPLMQDETNEVILDAVLGSSTFDSYRRAWDKCVSNGDRPEWEVAEVTFQKGNGLRFEHIVGWDIVLPSDIDARSCGRTIVRKADVRKADERHAALEKKLDLITSVKDAVYLTHANQCGFLVKHLDLMFIHTKNQWVTSVQTRIRTLSLEKLKLLVDATGQCPLFDLSTHIGETADWEQAEGMHKQFAIDLMNFMNLEGVVDIDSLLKQYQQTIGNTGYRSVESFGGNHDTVLDRLQERRKDIDPKSIEEYFSEGYAGRLL